MFVLYSNHEGRFQALRKKILSWIRVENYDFYSPNKGLTLEPTPASLATCQGQNNFTLAHQILVSKTRILSVCISPSLSISCAFGPKDHTLYMFKSQAWVETNVKEMAIDHFYQKNYKKKLYTMLFMVVSVTYEVFKVTWRYNFLSGV